MVILGIAGLVWVVLVVDPIDQEMERAKGLNREILERENAKREAILRHAARLSLEDSDW
jgi:hypothetical protein